jgi:hypothetical protein
LRTGEAASPVAAFTARQAEDLTDAEQDTQLMQAISGARDTQDWDVIAHRHLASTIVRWPTKAGKPSAS